MTTPLSPRSAPAPAKPKQQTKKTPSKTALLHGNPNDEEDTAEEAEAVRVARRAALAAILRDDLRTPYLTCQRCNSVTFINVNRVRSNTNPSSFHDLSTYEQLPVCAGCGTTKYLRAGVVSFQDKIDAEKLKIKEFEQKRGPATHLLVRIARGFLGRLAFRRRKRAHELYLLQIRLAATRIQTRVRGVQARKRTVYERCLRVIQTMHTSILQFAIVATPDRKPVFWYDHAGELQILFWNYREFVRRSGGKPPLHKVESNIMEITRRMLLREHALVSRMQACWRGLATRLVMVEYKRQRGWLCGRLQSPATKIQRIVRRHYATKRCKASRATSSYPGRLAAYCDERQQQQQQELAKAFRKKLLNKYRRTYQEGKTCKMLALKRPEEEEVDDAKAVGAVDMKHSLRQESPQRVQTSSESERSPQKHQQQQNDSRQRHPNARKLMEMKRFVDAKQQRRVRGPRLHILHAQEFARDEHES